MEHAPSLFISHGAPSFAIEPGQLGRQLGGIGARLSGLAAVLVVSPHWQTKGLRVTGSPAPATIHDFGGFPDELYRLRYPAPGAPQLATETIRVLEAAGLSATVDVQRGLDHGAWVPMLHLLPDARTPVFQVSMPQDLDAAGALGLGAALTPLRERGVMVVGSGSLTHNLQEVFTGTSDKAYAQEFAAWVRTAVSRRDVPALLDYRRQAPHALRAHPTEEHYLPLLVAVGASAPGDRFRLIEGGMTFGVLSMESYGWGLPPD